jgi:hypothetical protein
MTVSVADTIQALNQAVTDLLPPPAGPDLAPDILINPIKSHPTGIGGYIGLNRSPIGEIEARSLKAQVVIRLKADTLVDLGTAESSVTSTLIGANPTQLRSQGIFRISRDTSFSQFYNGAADGLTAAVGKDIRFDVDFEFQRPPDSPSGVISTIPLDLLLHRTDNPAQQLYGEDFDTDPMPGFTAHDDTPVTNGPGNWGYNSSAGQIEQSAGIGGGSNTFNASKRGSYLVLQPVLVSTQPENWLLHAEIGADSGGIGVVFNFQDIDNYYFFIMSLPTPYRLLGKKVDGSFSFLDSGGQDDSNGYSPGDHNLRLIQQNGELEIALDHTPIMRARENTPPPAGSIGFLSRNSVSARFQSLRWLAL